jgi:hypothetical protein
MFFRFLLTPNALLLTIEKQRYALCRSSEVLMPAIGFLLTPHSLRLTTYGSWEVA